MKDEPTHLLRAVSNPKDTGKVSPAHRVQSAAQFIDMSEILVTSIATYRMEGILGRGGMGTVHKARDLHLDRDVALKVLNFSTAPENPLYPKTNELSTYDRFLQETRIAAQLQHPNIPPVYDSGELPDGRPFLAMKLIRGRNLADLLAERSTPNAFSPRDLGIFEQICQAIAYAHSQNVIHRDLKPSNIMVGAFGEVQVMDWGVSRILSPGQASNPSIELPELPHSEETDPTRSPLDIETYAGSMVGTASFIPPEQARGERDLMDRQSDVFGLGAILAVILTGHPPYIGQEGTQVRFHAMQGRLADCYERLRQSKADPEWIELAIACLQPERAKRPLDAGVVAERVRLIREKSEERARRAEIESAQASVRIREERKRRYMTLILTSSLLVGLLFAGFVYLYLLRLEAEQRQVDQYRLAMEIQQHNTSQAEELRRQEITRNSVKLGLKEVNALEERGAWERASDLLLHQKELVETFYEASLKEEVLKAQVDLNFLREMDEIRLTKYEATFDPVVITEANRNYAEFFRKQQLLSAKKNNIAESAKKLLDSPRKKELIDALLDWMAHERNRNVTTQINQILHLATSAFYRDLNYLNEVQNRNFIAVADQLLQSDAGPSDFIRIAFLFKSHKDQIGFLERALIKFPADFWLQYALADIYILQKNTTRGIGIIRAVLTLRPEAYPAWNTLGKLLMDARDFDLANICFEKAEELGGASARNYFYRGNLLRARGDKETALNWYQRALDLDCTSPAIWAGLGRLEGELKVGDPESCFRTALKFNPKSEEALEFLGNYLFEEGRLEESLVYRKRHAELKPYDSTLLAQYGEVLITLKRYVEATPVVEKAIQQYPRNPLAQNLLGQLLLQKEKPPKQALTHFSLAVALEPLNEKFSADYVTALLSVPDPVGAEREKQRLKQELEKEKQKKLKEMENHLTQPTPSKN